MVEKAGFKGKFSELSVTDLEEWFFSLSESKYYPRKASSSLSTNKMPASSQSSVPSTTVDDENCETQLHPSLGKRKRGQKEKDAKPNMNLYVHNIVAHIPDFFELLDFKNSATERFEGFLASVKKTLNDSTNRDPSHEQAIQEVFLRHYFRAIGLRYQGKFSYPLYSKISKHFSQHHEFKELSIDINEQNLNDVKSFLSHLSSLGYSHLYNVEFTRVSFSTLEAAQELQAGLSPNLAALRLSAHESVVETDSEDDSEEEEEDWWEDPDEFQD